ncbi:Nuf2 family-domain-containing protein [Phycomyces nitens]|nr:Nuf2 family-domain-containing protein [Phycomyces nitens]
MEISSLAPKDQTITSIRSLSVGGDSTVYELPIFKTSELCDYLREMGFNITKNQLTHPESKDMVLLFKGIIHTIRSDWSKKIEQELTQKLSRLDHPELMTSSVNMQIVAKYMKRLLADIRLIDFDISDILNPEPARLGRILSAVVNYLKFRKQTWEKFQPYVAKHEEASSRIRRMTDNINALQKEKDRLIESRKAAEPEIQKMEEENEMFNQKLLEARRYTEALQNNINEIKKEKNVLKETLQGLLFKGLSIDEEISQLEIRLRINPKEEEKINEELKRSIQEDLSLEKKATDSFERLVRVLDIYNEIHCQYNDINETIGSLLGLMEEWELQKNVNDDVQKNYDIKESHLKALRARKNRLMGDIESLRLKEKQDLDELERTREHIQIQFDQLEIEAKKATEYAKQVREELNPIQASNDELARQITTNKETHQILMGRLREKYQTLNAKIETMLQFIENLGN